MTSEILIKTFIFFSLLSLSFSLFLVEHSPSLHHTTIILLALSTTIYLLPPQQSKYTAVEHKKYFPEQKAFFSLTLLTKVLCVHLMLNKTLPQQQYQNSINTVCRYVCTHICQLVKHNLSRWFWMKMSRANIRHVISF